MSHEVLSFGAMPDGREVHLHVLRGADGMTAAVTDLGACLVGLRVPDGRGHNPDVCLGFDGAAGYLSNGACMGAIVGRNANRIAGARFDLAGTTVRLAANEGKNNIHSGPHSYHERLWTATRQTDDSVTLNLHSRRGDQGLPGAVDINVTYTLDAGELRIDYDAMPDETTIINLTCHAYWNLDGHAAGSALDHTIQVDADAYTPVDDASIPTGEVASVVGTPLDLRTPRRVADVVAKLPEGLDANFVLHNDEHLERACTLVGGRSGIAMEVLTDSPGLQVYAAGGLNELGKDGAHYGPGSAIVLETQFWPDYVHHKNFPQAVYAVGHAFRFTTAFRFHPSADA